MWKPSTTDKQTIDRLDFDFASTLVFHFYLRLTFENLKFKMNNKLTINNFSFQNET